MDAEAFIAYILSNAPQHELEVLEKIIKGLSDNIASRRWGKPSDLQIGSNIEATIFNTELRQYGTVVGFTKQGCIIEDIGSEHKSRLLYRKYAIRILNDFDWNWVVRRTEEWNVEYKKQRTAEIEQQNRVRDNLVKNREKAMQIPERITALNGEIDIYEGAFVHAYRPDWGSHDYGVVVNIGSSQISLSNDESAFIQSVRLSKHEIRILDESEWVVVETEQRRRRDEYETAKKTGAQGMLPDYAMIEIPLDVSAKR